MTFPRSAFSIAFVANFEDHETGRLPFLILLNKEVLYNHFEVKFMPIKKIKTSANGTLPTAKDFPPPKKLTPAQKRLRDATRAAMKALDERIKKHGYPPDFRH